MAATSPLLSQRLPWILPVQSYWMSRWISEVKTIFLWQKTPLLTSWVNPKWASKTSWKVGSSKTNPKVKPEVWIYHDGTCLANCRTFNWRLYRRNTDVLPATQPCQWLRIRDTETQRTTEEGKPLTDWLGVLVTSSLSFSFEKRGDYHKNPCIKGG